MATKENKGRDRHLGRRVEFYIPDNEFDAMQAGMDAIHETNKSVFVRSAIKSFCDFLKSKEGKKTKLVG